MSGAAEARQADRHRPSTAQSSSRPSPTGYLVLMLEPQLLVACQQHCCRALFLHDGPRAARTTMRNALAVSRTLLAVFAPRVLRVSAAARRGAAAYADGAQRMVRARTHQSGLVRPPQSEIRWAFLHNFLRTCRWHPCLSVPHTSLSPPHIHPFSGPLWHHHTRPLHRHVTSPGRPPRAIPVRHQNKGVLTSDSHAASTRFIESFGLWQLADRQTRPLPLTPRGDS